MSTPTDAELVARCQDGDQAAWNLLAARYADLVFAIARRTGLSADEAGDVVQDVFVGLLKNIGKIRKKERVLAWIVQTTKRAAWKTAKRRKVLRDHENAASQERPEAHEPTRSELEALEEVHLVRTAYRAIGVRCRRLLDMLFLDEGKPSYTEVAERLGLAIGSVGPTRKRCLQELRDALATLGLSPDIVGKGVA